jgi:hypothetical protein
LGEPESGVAPAASEGRAINLNVVVQSLLLFLAVVTAVGLGIVTAYAAVTAILYYALGHHSEEPVVGPVLVETHASGD